MAKEPIGDIPGLMHVPAPAYIPLVAAGTDYEQVIFVAPKRCKITKARLVYDVAMVGQDTNTLIAKIMNRKADASGSTIVASKAFTNGVNAAKWVPQVLTPAGNDGIIEEGEVVTYLSDQVLTGLQDERHHVELDVQWL